MWWNKTKSSNTGRVASRAKALPTPLIISLEPRMLFDGAVAATVADTAHTDTHATTDAAKPAAAIAAVDHASSNVAHPTDLAATPTPVAPAVPGQTVVFVDSRVKDSDALLQGVAAGTQVVKLDASKDGLQQIADYLDQHHGVSSVEIVAHGNSGNLWLGDTFLSSDNVASRSAVLAEIGKDMNTGGDISIYACYTAEGAQGLAFVDSLAQLTGRDIAASNNRTGLGGDWTLEVTTGTIESVNALSAQSMAAYQYGLSTETVTSAADSGVGSLRAALSSAVAGDIVTFSTSGMTVNLTSELVITKNLTIEGDLDHNGTPDVTISGQYKTQVLMVNSGVTATLDGLIITKGLAVGSGGNGGNGTTTANLLGAGIVNFGNLTLDNVSVTANAAAAGGGGGGVNGGDVGGAGGGGGAVGGSTGGRGGDTGSGTSVYAGTAGTANQGGKGGGYGTMGGLGGSSSAGGAGSTAIYGYTNGSAGGTATSNALTIGGGGGGSGWNGNGGKGGGAAGGIYNASGATLTIIGTSSITGNVGAGGGGGGGSAIGSGTTFNGGDGGLGVGAIWNKGSVLITAANFAALSGTSNNGASGNGGTATAASAGIKPTAVNGLYNDAGGTANTAYNPAPTATISVSNISQHIGSSSAVTITFNQVVTGFTNSDLTVSNGTLSAVSSADGGTTWTATFTPNSGVTSATNYIVLDNTTVSGASGASGTGTTSSNSYAIDTVRPTATVTVVAPTLSTTVNSTVNITFSEAVNSFSLADMSASNGTLSNLVKVDNTHWTASLTPTAGNNTTGNVITLNNTLYSDIATNAGAGTTMSNTYAVDTVRPTASIVVANNSLNIGATSLVTFTFSEAVTGFTTADLQVANGTVSGLSTSDGGTTYTATLTPASATTATGSVITLGNTGVSDLSGNAGTGTTNSNSYAVDTQRPTATVVVANSTLSIGQTSLVTITFSEAVTGFTNADLTIANGVLSNVSSSDGGTTWTATLTPTTAITDSTNLITLDNTGVSDLSSNTGTGTTNSNNYAIDTQRPTASVVVSNSALGGNATSLVTVTFSEAVTGFTNADLTVANGVLSSVSSSDGGITWTATLTPTAGVNDATNVITLDNTGVADQSGNAGAGSTNSNNYTIDTQPPTATIALSDTALISGQTSLVTITFSEAVTGFTNADLSVPNGTLSAVSSIDGGVTWEATFTPTDNVTDTTNVISLNNSGVADLAGNAGSGTTNSANFTINTVGPTSTIVVADNALKIGDTSLVTITFSQAVTGFTNADLTIANGTLSTVSTADGGVTWAATLTPTSAITDSTNFITLDNTGVNGGGNIGSGVTDSNNYAIDTVRPTATVVVADNALALGQTSLVTITFSEAVSGFNNADLTVANGTLSAVSSSDGGVTWTATLTPTAGITDTSNVVQLDNTGVADLAGNAGAGTTDSNNYAIDSQRPTATIVLNDTALTAGESSLVTVTFSEAVTGFTNADLSVPNGTLSAVSSSDGGVTWTATFTPAANVHDTTNVITLANTGVADIAGNAGSGTTDSGNFIIDTVRPTATVVVANSALNIGQSSLVTITFSEAVNGFTNADLTVANGTLSAVSSSDGGVTYTATLTPTSAITDTSNLITLDNTGVQNASGNVGVGNTDSNNYSIDTVRPTANIVVADNALAIGQTSLVTITFSEAVTGFTNTDLTVDNGTLSNVSSSDGGITWTATLTPTAGITDTSNVVQLDNTGVADLAGNAGAGTTSSNNYGIDSQRPTATIVLADSALKAGETSLVTVTFSEAVSGFDNSDLSVANGTLSSVSSSDGGVTWTATFTPTASVNDTTNLISLNNAGVTDLAGNAGTGITNSSNYVVETVRPTASVVVAQNALNAGETSLVTVTFSQAVTGFTNADLTVANGSLSAVSSSDGGITWTATLTPTAAVTDTSNVITLDNTGVQSAAGNTGTGVTDSNNYVIDTAPPTATIVVANPTLPIGETSLVTITFSEAVNGFNNADLTIANGSLSAVSSSDGGTTWTATFTPNVNVSDATNLITLNNSGVNDVAGNAGVGTTASNNYLIDTQRPTATVVVADSALKAGQTTSVTITFSEAVSGFTNSDLSVANGTLSALASRDGGVTWTATLTPSTNLVDASNVITLNNAGVSDLLGNAGAGTTDSNNYVINTVRPTATIVVSNPILPVGETSQVIITFSAAVSGFDNSDLSVANGTLSAVSSTDGGVTWTATFTPTSNIADTTNLITLNNTGVSDLSGNSGTGTTDSNNYIIDTQRPTANVVVAESTLAIGKTTTVTISFSEAVSGFTNSDLTVANGTLSALASTDGGKTWTATLTPTANITDTSNVITLNNAGVIDSVGNAGAGATDSNNYAVDTQRPTATVVVANPALTAGQTSQVTVTFSEVVSGFDLRDLSATNGTLSNLATSDGGKTWTATLTPAANINVASNVVSLNTAGVTDLSGNAGAGTTDSNSFGVNSIATTGDPQFRTSTVTVLPDLPNVPLQPAVFGSPTGALSSPLAFTPLFEQQTLGNGVPTLGNIFINNQALAPSFIAQVFSSADGVGNTSSGFLGFGGGDGNSSFGKSTFSSTFGHESVPDVSSLNVFDGKGWKGSIKEAGDGSRGIFGAPTLGQQLHQLKENEQRQVKELALMLEQIGASEAQA